MLSFDSDSDSEDGKSWISMRSLKEAADIKTLYRKPSYKLSQSPNTSVTMECHPHTTTNQSISFSYLHEQYRTSAEDYFQAVELPSIKIDTSFGEDPAPSLQREFDILKCENSIHRSRRRQNEPTTRMREELTELRIQLQVAHKEIDRLRKDLGKRQQAHAIQLQELQEHHERKQQKIRRDIETLGGVDITKVREDYDRITEELKNRYEEQIEELKVEHELELQEKEESFEREIDILRRAETERKIAHKKEIEERDLEYQRLVESSDQGLETTIRSQAALISEQEQTIAELKRQLQGTFRKCAPHSRTPLAPSGKENADVDLELRSIIKQIKCDLGSCHLDSTDLSGSEQSLTNTLASLKSKIGLLTSAKFVAL